MAIPDIDPVYKIIEYTPPTPKQRAVGIALMLLGVGSLIYSLTEIEAHNLSKLSQAQAFSTDPVQKSEYLQQLDIQDESTSQKDLALILGGIVSIGIGSAVSDERKRVIIEKRKIPLVE